MKRIWWKEAVVYEIYTRSFFDSDGDGIGDIKGITLKLDYLKFLGIDVIWLSPVYKSPNDDNGYDISNYREIMDEFGTMKDWDELLDQAHKRGLKIIMDLVINHTSDEHSWFLESRSSLSNNKRDYYIWRKGKENKEPNNWASFFTPSAWKYDEETDEYFLHLFSDKQPDLNWNNKEVRNKIYEMMTWWLDKGVDGFRMDVINLISKAEGLPNAKKNSEYYYQDGSDFYMNGPKVHEYIKEMNSQVLSKYDIMTVGETPGVSTNDALLYVGEEREELNMVFQFELMDIDSGKNGKWDVVSWNLLDFKRIIRKWQIDLYNKGWNSLYLNNHDQPRLVSRFGDDVNYREESAKMLATMIYTLQGTPYIYQGEEIGMTNVIYDNIDDYRDIETLNMYHEFVIQNGMDEEKVMKAIYAKGRDNARTPIQWNTEKNAGFTVGTPWIKVNSNYNIINVEKNLQEENSVFYYYKKLIEIRKKFDVLIYGKYKEIYLEDNQIYSYFRKDDENTMLVILNFSKYPCIFKIPEDIRYEKEQLLISNYSIKEKVDLFNLKLRAYEARVYLLK